MIRTIVHPRLVLLCALLFPLAALAVSAQPALPAAAELEDGWNRLEPEGAVCAQGNPYAFFVRPADPARLLVYFQGGGACWDRTTCGSFGPYDRDVGDADEEIGGDGIFNFADDRNPLADYTMVFVSYCTGDVHTGSATSRFEGDDPLTIHFSGFANAGRVLDWTAANYPTAGQIVVAGTSAGAYGAIFNAWRFFDVWPNAGQFVLGDVGVGVLPPGWSGFDRWSTLGNLPAETDLTGSDLAITSAMYAYTLKAYPDARGAQYTTAADRMQTMFYALMGGDAHDWAAGMRAALAELEDVARFSAYLAPGDSHGILAAPGFLALSVDGVPLHEWIANWLAGEPVATVRCETC